MYKEKTMPTEDTTDENGAVKPAKYRQNMGKKKVRQLDKAVTEETNE